MRISKDQLQKIIAEEVQAHFKKSLMRESKSESRTIKATPAMLKRIINEEALKLSEMKNTELLLDVRSDGAYIVYQGKEKKFQIPRGMDGFDLGKSLSKEYGVNFDSIKYKTASGMEQPITNYQGF